MDSTADAYTGEVVYLLAELPSEHGGRVHEIGSRARVIGSEGDRLTLAVGGGPGEEVVGCARSLVAARRLAQGSRRQAFGAATAFRR